MDTLVIFNQANVDHLISTLDSLPSDQKAIETAKIRANLRCFIFENFIVSPGYQRLFRQAPDSVWKEFGFGIAMAIEEKNWTLTVTLPAGDPPPNAKCKATEQKVTVTYGPTGATVSKGVTFSYT